MEMQRPLHFRSSCSLNIFATFPNYLYILFCVCAGHKWRDRPKAYRQSKGSKKKFKNSQRNQAKHQTKPQRFAFVCHIMDNDFCRQLIEASEHRVREKSESRVEKKGKISWHGTNEVGLRFTERTKKKHYSPNEIQWQIWQKLQIENGSFLNFWWWINWMDAVAYSSHSVNEPFLEVGWNLFMDSVWCILRAFQLRLFFFSFLRFSLCVCHFHMHTHSLTLVLFASVCIYSACCA